MSAVMSIANAIELVGAYARAITSPSIATLPDHVMSPMLWSHAS